MDIRKLQYTKTIITLVVFEETGPREVEFTFSHRHTDSPDVMRMIACIEREERDVDAKAVRYLCACDLEVVKEGERYPFDSRWFEPATLRGIAVKVYEPMRLHAQKYEGFTAEERGIIQVAEVYAGHSWAGSYQTTISQTINKANEIIRRKRDERLGSRRAA